MATIVTSVRTRARLRVGRSVSYTPTVVEAAANGAGPFPAVIAEPQKNGTADILVMFPTATAKSAVAKGNTPGTFSFFGI